MAAHLDVITANGVPFRVIRLDANETGKYPRAVADEVIVEFYDRRYAGERFTADGQFVSRYFERTLFEDLPNKHGTGLCLDGGNRIWDIDAEAMDLVRGWLILHVDAVPVITTS